MLAPNPHSRIAGLLRAPFAWTLALWLAGLAITAGVAVQLDRLEHDRLQERFDNEVERVADDIERRFRQAVYGLGGARGVFAANQDQVGREAFRRYVASRNLPVEFPGVRAMGYLERVAREDVEAFVARTRADGAPDFQLGSVPGASLNEPDLYIIKYRAPETGNAAALGLDAGAEPNRRTAINRAMRTGAAALTETIRLASDEASRPSFLVLLPVYRSGAPTATPEERQAAVLGVMYAPLVLEELMQPGLSLLVSGGVQFQIIGSDGMGGRGVLFESGPLPANAEMSASRTLELMGVAFELRAHSMPALDAGASHGLVTALAAAGVLVSSLVAGVVWLLGTQRSRAEAVARRLTAESRRLGLVASETHDAVVLIDRQGAVEWVNDGFVRLSGRPLAEVRGRAPLELLAGAAADESAAEALRNALAQRQACEVTVRQQAQDGRSYWAELDLQPLRDDDGRPGGFMAVLRDITTRREAEAALRQSLHDNTLLMRAIDRATLYAVTDLRGVITEVNDAFARITGYRREELIGRDHRLLNSGLHLGEFWTGLWSTIATGRVWQGDIANRRKDGTVFWVHTTVVPFVGEDGGVRRYIAISHDITAAQVAQRELESQRTRLDSILQGTNVGTWEWHVPSGQVVFNERWAQIVGYTLDELAPISIDTWTRLCHPEDLANSGELLRRHFAGELDFYDCEARMRHKDGHWVWVHDRGRLARREADGRPGWMYGTHEDISARKAAEEALRSSEALLEQVSRLANVGGWKVDLATGTPVWSPQTCRIHEVPVGYQPTLDEGINFYAPEARPLITAAVERGLRDGTPWDLELPFITATGRRIWVRTLGEVEFRDGKPVGLVGGFQEITAVREQAEALRQAVKAAEAANEAKSAFLATMSHEIRTPMNAILGMLQLLYNTPLEPGQLDYVQKTESAARSLLGLLNDILDFSKIEAGKMTLDPQPMAMDRLLRELSVILSASVGSKPVEVLFDIDPTVPRRWLADPLRLQQILINLGGNAIKFTERGEVVLSVRRLGPGQAPGEHWVRIAVRDTGIGIAPEHREKIFAGFTQAEASTTRRFGGTGLGLAISRRLVDLMGGRLSLDSEVGRGSEFRIDLPVTEAAPEAPDSAPAEDRGDAAPWCEPGFAVLVVDDNPVARDLVGTMAQSLGWDVTCADSGEAALALLVQRAAAGRPFGACLIDWQMPGLDGWQTCGRIRALAQGASPAASQALIMMVTAYGREMLLQQSPEVQALIDGYLVKPITASMIFDALQDTRRGAAPSATVVTSGTVLRPLSGLRLLVVEDNAINQQVAEALLSGQGAWVDIADNGWAGVEAVRAAQRNGQPYDAVLMDMQMPVMDGLTATRTLREDPQLAGLTIIAMTANAMASDRQACLEAGMNEHIGKPFDLKRLVATLLQWTRGGAEASPPEPAATPGEPPVSASGAAAAAVLDRDGALQRVGGSAGLLDQLSGQFLRDLPAMLAACDTAVAAGDREAAQRALHTLKGVSATIGADRLAAAARAAEAACKAGTLPDLTAVQAAGAETRAALQAAGIQTPAAAGSSDAGEHLPLTADQRERLQRLLALLDASDMEVFDVMEALVAQSPPESAARWQALDAAVQNMDFGAAAETVRAVLASDGGRSGSA